MNPIVELAKSIYPEACFHETADAFKEFGQATFMEDFPGSYRICFAPFPKVDGVTFQNEFLNYLLGLSLERHLAAT